MTATGYSLLDFILKLLGDPQAQEEFKDDPQHVLQQQGFGGLCAQDVHDALPLVVDSVQGAAPAAGGDPALHHAPPATVLPGESHLDAAIRQLQYVTNNYSYADSHNSVVDSSVHQNIWADGDVRQSFDNHATTVTGSNDVTGDNNAVGDNASNGNEVHNGDGATNFGNGTAEDNSTHADVSGFGSGNVAVNGAGAGSAQTDTHTTSDSHNTTTVDSHNTSSATDSHDVTVQTHDPAAPHDGGNPCPDTDSHEVHGDSQHGLINVDHVLSDDNVNVDLLHNVHL